MTGHKKTGLEKDRNFNRMAKRLLACHDSAHRASICTSTAVNAYVRVNLIDIAL